MIRLPLAALSAAILLAACEPTVNPAPVSSAPPAAQPAPQPAIMPDPAAAARSSETVTEQTRVRPDGTVVTTTTTTATSVSLGGLAAALTGGALPAAAQPSAYQGQWQLRQADGQVCQLTLDGPIAGRSSARGFGCFEDTAFRIGSWSLRGTELVLATSFGDELAVLRATGPNRLEGGGLILYR